MMMLSLRAKHPWVARDITFEQLIEYPDGTKFMVHRNLSEQDIWLYAIRKRSSISELNEEGMLYAYYNSNINEVEIEGYSTWLAEQDINGIKLGWTDA